MWRISAIMKRLRAVFGLWIGPGIGLFLLLNAASQSTQDSPPVPAGWEQALRQPLILPALRVPPEVQVDGDLVEWREFPFLPLGLLVQTGFRESWGGREDLSARIYAGWNDRCLFFAGEVADQQVLASDAECFQNDSVEITLTPRFPRPPETTPAALHLWVLPTPPRPAVLGPDGQAALPGVEAAVRAVAGGYRWEISLPWEEMQRRLPAGPQAPPPTFDLAIQVNDYDEAGRSKGSIRWQRNCGEAPASDLPAGEEGGQRLELVQELTLENLARYLPALIAVGTERDFVLAEEESDLLALIGLPPAFQGAALELEVVDPAGVSQSVPEGTGWSSGLFFGRKWRWRPPAAFAGSRLLRVHWNDPRLGPHACWGQVRSAGDLFQALKDRLAALTREVEELERHPDPAVAEAVRHYAPPLLMQLQVLGEQYGRLPTWSVRYELTSFQEKLDRMEQRVGWLQAGQDPLADLRGTVLKAYRSEIDDTLQPYSVHIPQDYGLNPPPPPTPPSPPPTYYREPFERFPTPYGPFEGRGWPGPEASIADPPAAPTPPAALTKDSPWPLLVTLHGYGSGWRPWAGPATGFIVLAPQGRGNGDYRLWCQMDVLRTIEEVKRDYRIDEDRVYITGGSMGGTGSWFMAVHYPDLFAALAPICGNTDHHVWEEVWGWGQKNPTPLTKLRNYLEDIEDASFFAENLKHVPSYFIHGDADDIVPVGHSRAMARRLAELGYEYVYEEKPGVGHSVGASDQMLPWLWQRRRNPFPRQVVFKTAQLYHQGAYWVEIQRFAELLRPALIRAEVQDGNRIQVQVDNVARYALTLREPLVDPTQPVSLTTNGQPTFTGPIPPEGRLIVGQTAAGRWERVPPREGTPPLEKNARVGGPIEHAFMSRFLLVYGTTGRDELENQTNFQMADEFAQKWVRWANARPRMKADVEVTEQDIAESNLILYGGPASNQITARINSRLPIRIEGSEVVMGRRRFRNPDVGVKLCYPNPLNPDRYVCVFAGVNWRGTYGINGRFGNWFDWGIYDDRNWFDFGIFDNRTTDPEGWLAVGFFDQDWQLNEKYIFYGDESVRAATRPYRPPAKTAEEAVQEGEETVYLSDLRPQSVSMEKGTLCYDQSFSGRPLELGGKTYERGLGVHPHAEVVYHIGGLFWTFEAYVGADLDPAGEKSGPARDSADKVEYEVYGDGRLLARTGTLSLQDPPRHLYVPVSGVQELKLVAASRDGRKWLLGDANWALARLETPLQARVRPPFTGGYETLSLDGEWLLEGMEVGRGVEQSVYEGGPYLPRDQTVLVPGTVQAALMESGKLPDLYRDSNWQQAAWVESQEWWHYRTFQVPQSWQGRAVQLRLEGVNYQADLWLNGRAVGTVTGMFQPGVFEVARLLNYGADNFLAVRVVAAPADWALPPDKFQLLPRERALTSPLSYGYGGFPRLFPLGLWRSVTLRATGPVRLESLAVVAQEEDADLAAAPGRAILTAEVSSCTDEPLEAVLKGHLSGPDGSPPIPFTYPISLEPRGRQTVRVVVTVPQVRRWTPQGAGEQALYRLEASVEIPGPLVSDRAATTFGFPDRRRPPGPGDLRMARWLPPDALLRLDTVDYENLLRLAQEAGLNALRVEGGGMPETDRFYDLCDQRGIWVVQDFPLAEADYRDLPRQPFLQAARHLVRRLRHHPCLLMWVGGRKLDPRLEGNQTLLAELAEVVREEDPARPFYPTLDSLDRDGFPAAPPVWGHLGRFLTAEKIWPLSEAWLAHGLRSEDQERLQADYGTSDNGPEWVCKAHLQQMAAYRRQVETDPPSPSFCLGPFNEPWPGISPSLVDWWGVPRPAYYAVKRASQTPAVWAVLPHDRWLAGETLTATLFARSDRPQTLTARLLKPDRTVVVERRFDLPGRGRDDLAVPVGTLEWRIPSYQASGLFLLHLTLAEPPASKGQASVALPPQHALYWLSVARPSQATPQLRVLWMGVETPWLQTFWDHLRRQGIQVAAWSGPPQDLSGYEVYVVSPPAAGSVPSAAELQTVCEAVRNGAGLLLDGWSEEWDRSSLGPVLPFYFLPDKAAQPPAGPAPTWTVPDHPVLAGLDPRQMPGISGSGLFSLRSGAASLLEWSSDRPLLVEGTYGRGRVLAFLAAPEEAPLLSAWPGREAFYAGALGYLGKLSHPALRALVRGPVFHPFSELDQLPAVAPELTVEPRTVRVRTGRPQTLRVTVKNPTDHLVLLALLELRHLPAALRAYFQDNAFPLGGREARTVEVTLSLSHRAFGTLKLPCVLSGWKLEEKTVEVEVKLEG